MKPVPLEEASCVSGAEELEAPNVKPFPPEEEFCGSAAEELAAPNVKPFPPEEEFCGSAAEELEAPNVNPCPSVLDAPGVEVPIRASIRAFISERLLDEEDEEG